MTEIGVVSSILCKFLARSNSRQIFTSLTEDLGHQIQLGGSMPWKKIPWKEWTSWNYKRPGTPGAPLWLQKIIIIFENIF